MTVMDLEKNQWATVEAIEGDLPLCVRLLEMGFTPGEKLRRTAKAPFSDPVAVNIRGSVFALRENEADCVKISIS